MRRRLFIYLSLIILGTACCLSTMLPRRQKGCVIRPDKLTLSTVELGKFVESIPLSAHVSEDSVAQQITAQLDELYFTRVTKGLIASTFIKKDEIKYAVIGKDSAVVDGRFQIVLAPIEGAKQLVPGRESLRMRLIFSEADNTTMLSVGGFYKDSGGKYVYVVSPDRSAVRRDVVLGRKNPESIEVLSGLKPGEVVITSSYENLPKKDTLSLDDIGRL